MNRRGRAAIVAGALVVASLQSGSAHAAGKILTPEPLQGQKITLDGLYREWPGKMSELSFALRGGGSDPRVSGQIGYDDSSLYLAMKVVDAKLVRTAQAGSGEDHATLVIALPKGGSFVTREIDVYPGLPGKLAGVVKMGGSVVAGAKAVEAPSAGGFTLEAQIPWSALPEAATVRVGLRGALKYTDADSPGSVSAVVATANAFGGSALPALPLEAEQGLEDTLLRPKGLPNKPARELIGDLVGDGMKERVAIFGGFLSIVGPRYKGGKQFYFKDLGIESAAMVTRLELVDADGDGKQEILMRRRLGGAKKYREILSVIKVASDEQPYEALVHEIAIVTEDGKIENDVKVTKATKGVTISIAQGTAEGFDPASYGEPMPSDMDSALLPWQSTGKKIYEWDKTAFVKRREEPWQPKLPAPGSAPKRAESGPPAPPPPRPPTADELLDRVYALYRRDRSVGAQKPRFDFVTDVAGGRETERVLVHGADVVVFGRGFKGGTSYAYITLNVKDPSDVVHVDARDLTGDGKAEILVRAVLPTKTSKELGGAVVKRHALVVYTVTDAGVKRIFGAETGRELEGNQILGRIAFAPAGHGFGIELKSGRAIGWDAQSYPFPADTLPAGGLEHLLLPWSDLKQRAYRFDGNAFVR